jgi:putative ABC transport system permease protein
VSAIGRGVKNTFRNAIRTVGIVAILAVAIALAVSGLVARSAVDAKVSSVRAASGTTITVTPAGGNFFFGNGTTLSNADAASISTIDHVTAVYSSFTPPIGTQATNLTAPTPPGAAQNGGSLGFRRFAQVRVIGTNRPANSLESGANNGQSPRLVSGTTFSPTSNADVAVVGSDTAAANNLKVGSTFSAFGATTKVVGIFDAGSSFANSEVLMPLATVQRLSNSPGQVTAMSVIVDDLSHVAGVQSAIEHQIGTSADVTSQQQAVQSQLAPLSSVRPIATYTLIGATIGAGVILLLSMLMIVRERRREIGVLKAIGAPNRSVVTQFVAEATTFTVLGAIGGLLLGLVVASPFTNALVSANTSSDVGPGGFFRGGGFAGPRGGGPRFGGGLGSINRTLTEVHAAAGWSTLVLALVVAVVVAAIGSSVAVATVVRVRPAEVLRSE